MLFRKLRSIYQPHNVLNYFWNLSNRNCWTAQSGKNNLKSNTSFLNLNKLKKQKHQRLSAWISCKKPSANLWGSGEPQWKLLLINGGNMEQKLPLVHLWLIPEVSGLETKEELYGRMFPITSYVKVKLFFLKTIHIFEAAWWSRDCFLQQLEGLPLLILRKNVYQLVSSDSSKPGFFCRTTNPYTSSSPTLEWLT